MSGSRNFGSDVSLQVRMSARLGVIWIVGGVAFLVAAFLPDTGVSIVFRLIALFMGPLLLLSGIQELKHRRVVMEVTAEGILLCGNVRGTTISPLVLRPLLIPWQRVKGMEYFDQKRARLAGLTWVGEWGGYTDPCIVVSIREDAGWPPPAILRRGPRTLKAKPGEIPINVSMCEPGGLELWRRLQSIYAAHRSGLGQP